MRHVVFETPGEIDIRAFTVFGASSKPRTDSPIGFFGTGLKYAVGVLCRHDIPIKLLTAGKEYNFYANNAMFRETKIAQIRMKKVSGLLKSYENLPFTTELGKTWELWQVFRELEANTRDEQGTTCLVSDADGNGPICEGINLKQGYTRIVVSGEAFVQEFLDRDKTFLPGGLRRRDESTDEVQVLDRKSEYIYWRGMRVYKLEAPSELTYNVLSPVDLTEDRTLKYSSTVEWDIKRWLASKAPEETVSRALKDTNSWEGRTSWDYLYTTPSPRFKAAAEKAHVPSVRRYVDSYAPPKPDILDGLGPFETQGHMICDGKGRELNMEQYKRVCEVLNAKYPAKAKVDTDEEIPF